MHSSVVTKDKLIAQFDAVVTETERLLKTAATAGGEQVDAVRASAEHSLKNAKDRLRDLRRAATDSVDEASGRADAYVHEHPWQSIGVAAGLTAVVAGVVIGLLLSRR